MVNENTFWQTKLHARLHDPAEKALVLLRDPAGHENGTSRALHRDLGFDRLKVKDWLPPDHDSVLNRALFNDDDLFKKGIPVTMYKHVKRADWWAAAADRPQWPMEEITVTKSGGAAFTVARWAQVRWSRDPILTHPLTGETLDLKTLANTEITDIKQRSLEHFRNLIVRDGNNVDWRKTSFAFWRFGPELKEDEDGGKLGFLWPLLPADTRVPDHSIWDHLDLTSAFAGAFCRDANDGAALLSLSIGPVQSFIAAARTTSDLWAGSHLLARLSWEAMKVVCERLGPDAVLFPRLRGLPQADLWLRDEIGLPKAWFEQCGWTKSNTDANPLFAAALPNRFVAVAPECEVETIAEEVTGSVRAWLRQQGEKVVRRLLDAAGLESGDETPYCFEQMRNQLERFPEVHWAAAPFSLIEVKDKKRDTGLDTSGLAEVMRPFFGLKENRQQDAQDRQDGEQPGFLGSPAWKVLGGDIESAANIRFFSPNPGALYPAMQDLTERVLAAAKAVRPFGQLDQQGWRCSLTGETEWLTADKDQLRKSYRNQNDTLWAKVAQNKPAWAKKGEHLGALPAIKRLWPTLFAEEVGKAVQQAEDDSENEEPMEDGGSANRFVVSTHTMALAGDLERLHEKLSANSGKSGSIDREFIRPGDRPPALPRALARSPDLRNSLAAKIPAALDRLREDENGEDKLHKLESELRGLLGYKPETYYALVLFDGDRMGRILSGDQEDCATTYLESFHPNVREDFEKLAEEVGALKAYGKQKRAVSPNRHLAVSAALNDFALHVVPEIVERECRGRVIYAGGDDVLAMLPVGDLLFVMPRLREAYSGAAKKNESMDWGDARNAGGIVCRNGFAYLPKRGGKPRLMRMMGKGATASCGAVVAHHQTPLSLVLRELRASEQRAKREGGRNAFSLTILKRSGGALRFTDKWGEVMELLADTRRFLAGEGVSRRAAYNSLVWLKDLPADPDQEMLGGLLAHQLARQTQDEAIRDRDIPPLARRLAFQATTGRNGRAEKSNARQWLENFLCTAEFLSREVRSSRFDNHSGRGRKAPAATVNTSTGTNSGEMAS